MLIEKTDPVRSMNCAICCSWLAHTVTQLALEGGYVFCSTLELTDTVSLILSARPTRVRAS